jgi:hypothetical protein
MAALGKSSTLGCPAVFGTNHGTLAGSVGIARASAEGAHPTPSPQK